MEGHYYNMELDQLTIHPQVQLINLLLVLSRVHLVGL